MSTYNNIDDSFNDNENLKVSNFSEYIYTTGGMLFNDYKLFIKRYNALPHYFIITNINLVKLKIAFLEKYKSYIVESTFRHQFSWKKSEFNAIEEIYFLNNNCQITFEYKNNSEINIAISNQEKYHEFLTDFIEFVKGFKKNAKSKSNEINLITKGYSGLELTSVSINKVENLIDTNYNDDFSEISKHIIDKINAKNQKGIYLLHGEPGTGKTTYIRWLITQTKKKVLFVSPHIAENIINPEFIDLIINNPNSILIIEDAEIILTNRNQNANSSVSVLLNIADGLLADCLNTQIICTFNTNLSSIDEALLRKGRLIAKYEFKKLSIEKAQNLALSLNIQTKVTTPLTLAEVYNLDAFDYGKKEEKKIGF